jgi:hypothetical protein
MLKNIRWLSLSMGALNNVFAWMLPVVYLYVEYDGFFETTTGLVMFPAIVASVLAFRFAMHRFKTIAETGVAMDKEIAREVRFVVPLLLLISLLEVIQYNVGGIVDVLSIAIVSNLVAVPFRIASYRTSARYERDVASMKLYQDFQKTQKH